MNGLGNDFVVLDARAEGIPVSDDQARAIADRNTGIGCDQLIVMEQSPIADVKMRIWNAEGGEVQSCGNASRCIADIVMDERKSDSVTIDTKGGFLSARRAGPLMVTIDQGKPRFGWKEIPLSEAFADTRHIELQIGPIDKPLLHSPSVVNVGNPHCIFWVSDLDVVDFAKVGPMIEHHPLFPRTHQCGTGEGCVARSRHPQVWERGAGLTKACGTAACAVMAAGHRLRLIDSTCRVTLPGGDLQMAVNEENGHILMTGPVEYEYEGVLPAGCWGEPMSELRIETFGCRLNTFESEIMRGHAEKAGLSNAIVFNTCAVTAEATRQVRQAIRKAHKENPEAEIIVTGCAAQTEAETFAPCPR